MPRTAGFLVRLVGLPPVGLLLVGLLLVSCQAPQLWVQAAPAGSTVYIDGQAASRKPGEALVKVPLAYYGKVAVAAQVHPRVDDEGPGYREERRLVPVHPPFSGWLFPFDFLLEIARHPFDDHYEKRVDLILERRTLLVPGIGDPDSEAIRTRAREAQLER